MQKRPRYTLSAAVLDCPDAHELAAFYRRLFGWAVRESEPDWVMIAPPEGGTGLSFQTEPQFVRPTWPAEPGAQQMMLHLDIGVDDLDSAVAHAGDMGAQLADVQPQDDVRVMLDPVGHPFCLYVRSPEESDEVPEAGPAKHRG
ncbi:VOC family protein [Streptomyces sp. NPDC048324]|uniref:VOC family protein n=1 Tax=Streptomyces sp. NPDC048324 TaxID=3157205 RepID=UPI00343C701E